MGMLINGELANSWLDKEISEGEFHRMESSFRNWVSAEDAEIGRYHLFVSDACPWAHRTIIFRKLKKLESVIGISHVEAAMLENGWTFSCDGKYQDNLFGLKYLYELYQKADARFTGQITVPVLWDKKTGTIVNNESSEIIRMLNSSFNHLTEVKTDYYPEHLRMEIDEINQTIYQNINNGVYRCGFATTQTAYEKAFDRLFHALNEIEIRLGKQRYLVGNQITEADWRLFTTLLRFDAVYFGHFKCNLKRIADYPNLSGFLRELYQIPGVAETVDMDFIKRHYYYSHTSINPTQIIPKGPETDFNAPHNRNRNY